MIRKTVIGVNTFLFRVRCPAVMLEMRVYYFPHWLLH